MRISFDFDEVTKKVSNVVVEQADKGKPKSASKASKESGKIVLKGSSLKLTQEALDLLNVGVGDKLLLSFTNDRPALVTPEIANMPKAGNLITKSLTLSCKGKVGETLSTYGSEWDFKLDGDGFLVLSNNITDQVDRVPEVTEMHKEILDDNDFLSTVDNGEEIEFTLDFNNKK